MSETPHRAQQGDEHELFERHAARLRRETKLAISTTPEIVDDACAFAWMKLVENQPRRETVFPWLRAVARNKALELDRLARAEASRQTSLHFGDGGEVPVPARRGRPEVTQRLLELRERVMELPPRTREMVFLQAAGWRYSELAEHFGVGSARVNFLLTQAKIRMREMDLRELEPTSPRGRRLREIENEPPQYIVAAIGRRPAGNPKRGEQAVLREWKRLVLEIEDYRKANGITDRVLPLGRESDEPQRDVLKGRIAGYRRDRGLSVGIER
jgi:DNA-directed RNA polymerase specialized sigma24 family protein